VEALHLFCKSKICVAALSELYKDEAGREALVKKYMLGNELISSSSS